MNIQAIIDHARKTQERADQAVNAWRAAPDAARAEVIEALRSWLFEIDQGSKTPEATAAEAAIEILLAVAATREHE